MKRITTAQAAEIIGCSRHHVSLLINQGKLKAERFGNWWMVDRGSAEAYASSDRKPGVKKKSPPE